MRFVCLTVAIVILVFGATVIVSQPPPPPPPPSPVQTPEGLEKFPGVRVVPIEEATKQGLPLPPPLRAKPPKVDLESLMKRVSALESEVKRLKGISKREVERVDAAAHMIMILSIKDGPKKHKWKEMFGRPDYGK